MVPIIYLIKENHFSYEFPKTGIGIISPLLAIIIALTYILIKYIEILPNTKTSKITVIKYVKIPNRSEPTPAIRKKGMNKKRKLVQCKPIACLKWYVPNFVLLLWLM